MTTRSVASKQFRKQEAFSQAPPPPPPPQRTRIVNPSKVSSQQDLVDQTKKLTVSDAIGLITIRLSKVESYLIKNKDSIDGSVTSTTGEHADLDTIVRNLVNRINVIEKEHSVLKSIVETEEYKGQSQQNSPEPQIENLFNTEQFFSLSNRLELLENDPKLANLSNMDTLSLKVEKNTQEIQEMKQMVIKLQTMLLESLISKNVSTSVPSTSVSVDL